MSEKTERKCPTCGVRLWTSTAQPGTLHCLNCGLAVSGGVVHQTRVARALNAQELARSQGITEAEAEIRLRVHQLLGHETEFMHIPREALFVELYQGEVRNLEELDVPEPQKLVQAAYESVLRRLEVA